MSDSRLLQPSPIEADAGGMIGRDPRDAAVKEILKADAERPSSRGKAIRAKCLDCSGAQISEVRKCAATGCALWPFRMGTDPFRAPRDAPPGAFGRKPVDDEGEEPDEAPAETPAMPIFVNPFLPRA